MNFHKYHALGNDMVVIDPAHFLLPLTPHRIQLICHRHFGVGADGICYGPLPDAPHSRTMRFFNPDGSEAEKSGNGLRIFARYLWDMGYVNGRSFDIVIHETLVPVQVLDETATTLALHMGRVSVDGVEKVVTVAGVPYRGTAVSVGNPHFVLFHLPLTAIHTVGPGLETADVFPQRTNVQLVQVLNPHTIQIEIWERGAGYTLASGTSACAAAAAACQAGFCRSPVTVKMAGGDVQVEIDERGQVILVGRVTAVYQGTFAPDFL